MNIKNLEISQELFRNKNTCEKHLEELNDRINQNASNCKHFPVIVTKGTNTSPRCLTCGIKLNRIKGIIPDASDYKEEKYGEGYNERQRLERLNDLRAYAINWLYKNTDANDIEFKQAIVNEVKKTKRLD